jgi:hypothetical protein
MAGCLAIETVRAWLGGDLSPEARAAAAAHV